MPLFLLLWVAADLPAASRWSAEGHRLVCEIAWQRLSPGARSLVQTIRAADPEGGSSFAESCVWADRVRPTTHQYTYGYHFINIPPGGAGAVLERDCADPERRCAPWAIHHYTTVLLDPQVSPLARAEALKFLGHFVGDIHQPLHAGRLADRGGNDLPVDFFGDSLNLHAVWDGSLLRRAGLAWPDSAAALSAEPTAAGETLNVMAWVNESYQAAESLAYRLPEQNRIDTRYLDAARAVAREAIKRAGARLALLLNRIAAGTLDPASLGVR